MSPLQTTVKVPSQTPEWNLDVWQYLPTPTATAAVDPPRGPPVIIMAHGFGANKKMGLRQYAEVFVANGYAVLLFDYRHWGDSDGVPRNVLLVNEQLEDYRTMIRYAKQPTGLFDPARVILWGASFSGGHIMQLASEDHELAAAIGQCPFADGLATVLVLSKIPLLKMAPFAIFDGIRSLLPGYTPIYVKNSVPPGSFGMLSEEGVHDEMCALATDRESDYPNQIQASAMLQFLYKPASRAKNILCPFLLTIPLSDNLCPPAPALAAVNAAPKGEFVRVKGGHFDCYPGFSGFEENVTAQLEFFQRVVPV